MPQWSLDQGFYAILTSTVTDDNQQDYPGKLGNTMVLLAWAAFFIVLSLLFAELRDREFNPNRQISSQVKGGAAEVTLTQNRAGHYVATANINGVLADVMIDTGASDVSVPLDLAQKMGLERGPMIPVSTANGTIRVYGTRIESIELGHIRLKNVRANINPHMYNDYVLLGMSFLDQVEFSHSQDILILRQY